MPFESKPKQNGSKRRMAIRIENNDLPATLVSGWYCRSCTNSHVPRDPSCILTRVEAFTQSVNETCLPILIGGIRRDDENGRQKKRKSNIKLFHVSAIESVEDDKPMIRWFNVLKLPVSKPRTAGSELYKIEGNSKSVASTRSITSELRIKAN